MKELDIAAINAKTLESASQLGAHATLGWIYRGQACSRWQLLTTLDRCCDRHAVAAHDRIAIEQELRREFRRAYHDYAAHVPAEDSVLERLSLMQHYGAPTRLLDFTYSLYVAAYFAVETTSDRSAVWEVNAEWAKQQSVLRLREAGKDGDKINRLQARFVERTEPIVEHLFFEPPAALVAYPVNPFRINE